MKFSDWFEINMGQSPEGHLVSQEEIGLPLLNGPSEFTSNYPIPVQYTSESKKVAEIEDLLFCVRGSTTGRMNWADQRYAIGRGLASIRSKSEGDLIHFGRAILDLKLPELLAGATGSTFPNVSKDMIGRIEIPDIDKKTAIGVSQFLKVIRDKIELNNQMNETLEAMAKAIFKEWFIDFGPVKAKMEGKKPFGMDEETAALFPDSFEESELGMIPRGWRVERLDNICKRIFSGGTPNSQNTSYWSGALPWLSSGETREHFIVSTEKKITQDAVEKSSTRLATKNSTVVASAGQGHTRGQTSLLLLDTFINQSIIVLECNSEIISPNWLYLDISRRYEQLRQISDGNSSRGSLTTKLLAEIQIAVPSAELINCFDSVVSGLFKMISNNLFEKESLKMIRDLLLPKLISGEIDFKNGQHVSEVK